MCLPFRRRNLCATCSIATPMQSTTSPTSPSSSNIFSLNSNHLDVFGGSSMCCFSFRSFHSRRYHHKSSSSAFPNLMLQHSVHPHHLRCQTSFLNAGQNTRLPLVSTIVDTRMFVHDVASSSSSSSSKPVVPGLRLSSVGCQHNDRHAYDMYRFKLNQQKHRHEEEQLANLFYKALFGKNARRVLTENEKNVAYYNMFLETVDLIGQNVSPDKDSSETSHSATPPPPLPPPPPPTTPTSSSSSSSSASSSTSPPTSKSEERKLQQQQKRQHHRHCRIFCYGVARWINNRTYCNSLRFEDFYQNELPSYSRVKDAESERFIKQWSKALSDADFRHYLSTTIMNAIKKARCDAKSAFTIATMAERLAEGECRYMFFLMSAAFGRVFATKEDVESLKSRNVKFYELIVPTQEDIALQPEKVFVVSGASGSGKTITALAAATREPADVVFYTIVKKNLLSSESEALETRYTTSEQKTRRNKIVKEWVMEKINKILEASHYALLVDEFICNYNVVIVVDDVGSYSGFLAGLCASLEDLSIELHNKFFLPSLDPVANKEDWHEKSRIRFVAAGSGASFGTAHATPNVDRYDTYFIGKQNSKNTGYEAAPIFATILSGIHKRYRQFNDAFKTDAPPHVQKIPKMLKRLDPEEQRRIRLFNQQTIRDYEANPEDSHRSGRCQEAWITPTEKATADLVTNARCAALLVNLALDEYDDIEDEGSSLGVPRWWTSVAAFNKRLQCWIPVIIEKYISTNAGLRKEPEPMEIIRFALAATIFRLPCLPDCSPWSSSLSSLRNYTRRIITSGGVLVDYAAATKSTKGMISLDDVVDLSEQDRKCALKVDETTARYYTSPAHVVMFRGSCGLTLDRPPELSDSSSFKYDIAEFCALTLICASAYNKMARECKFLVDWKTKKSVLDRFDEEYNYKYDSLFGLKKKLACDYCRGAKILHHFDSPLLSMPKYISAKKKDEVNKFEKSARAKATMLRAEIEASLAHEEAVVIISKEMESFADVIVVSADRVMLIQCKQKLQPRKKYLKKLTAEDNRIEWVDDIEKMCGLDPDQSPTRKQRRADKMRNIYLDELKSAAASVDDSSDVTDVEVELVFVVEGEKEVCNLFAEAFKRLQVTDENTTNTVSNDSRDEKLRPNKQLKKNDQELFPSISEGAKTISAEKYSHEKQEITNVTRTTRGYPISFFGVHRPRQTTTGQSPPASSSSSHSYPPPLFPVPDYSEGVRGSQDNGCCFACGEHLSSEEYFMESW